MITRVKVIGVCVSDQARAVEFFTKTLGFEIKRDEPMGPTSRWVELAPSGAQTVIVPFTPPELEDRIGSFTMITLECDDIEATYADLSGKGVVFSRKPEKTPWGSMAIFKDPDGNEYVLVKTTPIA